MLMNLMKRREVLAVFSVVLLSTLFFALGYLYAKEENPAPIFIQKIVR